MKRIHIDSLMQHSKVGFGTSGARGLVADMTDEVCYAYTKAFLEVVSKNCDAIGKVVLGHDLRPSSPNIATACASAISDAGGEVVYVGALPTPAIAFYASSLNALAIVVTGSHIPFDRNGIKFYRHEGEISKSDEHAIKDSIVKVPLKLNISPLNDIDDQAERFYIRRYVDFFGEGYFKSYRIALYEHSSVARDLLRKILEDLGAEVISLGRTDTFTPIDTEAVRPEDIEQAKSWAQSYNFDAIFSTDGDADRPLIGDELGQWFRGDVVGALCAKFIGANVVATPVSCNTIIEKSTWFKRVIRTRIGSPYVIDAMQKVSEDLAVVVGFEANGGFLLGSDVNRNGGFLKALPTRDALLPMLALLGLAKESGVTLSVLSLDLPRRYTHSDRLQNISSEKSQSLLASLRDDHQKIYNLISKSLGDIISVDETDGLRVTFINDDIIHLRPSGNAPELRCYTESNTVVQAKLLCQQCLESVHANL